MKWMGRNGMTRNYERGMMLVGKEKELGMRMKMNNGVLNLGWMRAFVQVLELRVVVAKVWAM